MRRHRGSGGRRHRVAGDPRSYDEDDLPPSATASVEADLLWLADGPLRERAELVNGAIGEMSMFDEANGYYAEGVSIETAVLPDGWQRRLRTWSLTSSLPARPLFLDKHDLTVAKLAAGRPKDIEFAQALLQAGLLDHDELRERAALLPPSTDRRTVRNVAVLIDSFRRPGQRPSK